MKQINLWSSHIIAWSIAAGQIYTLTWLQYSSYIKWTQIFPNDENIFLMKGTGKTGGPWTETTGTDLWLVSKGVYQNIFYKILLKRDSNDSFDSFYILHTLINNILWMQGYHLHVQWLLSVLVLGK